ncbi:hypothetical protein HOG16_04905 [Candidatus Woesearchaeota archaeon]|mgnify:CR=1 FL=1|nr:hypothetical protein [Candidatus Woesearchaeota archaeon]MBT4321748.1 hypothetical protein [Candidatus Woesearchaeota archaeon]MBT4631160.1 hypothetical protein [Candidatus Woesearchaeota archaeon]
MGNIKKSLSENQTILLTMDSAEYNKIMINSIKSLSTGTVCYVTTNKTFDALKETFKKSKIIMKNIVFIDAISKTIKKTPSQKENVYYVSSPGALTELSLVIDKFLRHEFNYLIFDSITNLNIYNKTPICAKFMTSLINKIKKGKTKAIFYAIGSKENELINQVGTYVDKVISTN